MVRYGRFSTSDPAMGAISAGSARACTYATMPENGWATSVGAHVGRVFGTDSPSVRYGIYTTSSGTPNDRMAYTALEAVNVTMTSGAGGTAFTANIAVVDPLYGPSSAGVKLSSGSRYAIAILAIGDVINHGMIAAGSISETYESFYNRSGAGSIPPDPYGTTSSSIEGWISAWINYDANVKPEIPTSLAPVTSVSSTTPTFTANFRDRNGAYGTSSGLGADRGDIIKQYQVQLRANGTTTLKWDTTYSANNAEQSANAITRVYGGTSLTPSTAYEWRIRMSDQFGTWSDWTGWTDFTVSGGGTVTLDGTPTGKQEAITGLVFEGRWTHQSALAMDKVKIRLIQNSAVIGTSGEISKAAVSSPSPGTLFSINQSQSSIFNSITWGQSYLYQIMGRASDAVWSDWSAERSFNINFKPNTPFNLAPNSLSGTSSLPLLTATMTDDDDSAATGLKCYAQIFSTPIPTNASFALGNASSWSVVDKHANATVTSNDVTYQSGTVYDADGDAGQVDVTASTVPTTTLVLTALHDTYFPVEATNNYAFQIAARTNNANLRPRRVFYWYDASQVFLSATTETDPVHAANTWYSLLHVGIAPTNAKYVRFGVSWYSASANQTGILFIDALELFEMKHRIREMSQVAGSAIRWEYQTVTDEIFAYNTYYWNAFGNDGSTDGDESPEAAFVYANGPVVSITSPTASQVLGTSTPTITWTVTDQQRFQVIIYDDDGVTVMYNSGEITSVTGSHLVPSGYLFNSGSYKLQVTVWDSAELQGSSALRAFSVVYDAVTPVSGFDATGRRLRFDTADSAVLLSWEETNYSPSQFEHYSIYRRESSQTDGERILLREISSPGHTTFLDMNPGSDVEYIYSVSQTINIGSEELESETTDASFTVNLPYTVITSADEADDYRIVIKYWTDRGWDENTDAKEILPWGASKPTTVFGSVYFRTITLTARFVTDSTASLTDYQEAIRDLLGRRGIVCYRDPKGRRIFGVLKKNGHRDTAMATVLEVSFEITETNYDEGVE